MIIYIRTNSGYLTINLLLSSLRHCSRLNANEKDVYAPLKGKRSRRLWPLYSRYESHGEGLGNLDWGEQDEHGASAIIYLLMPQMPCQLVPPRAALTPSNINQFPLPTSQPSLISCTCPNKRHLNVELKLDFSVLWKSSSLGSANKGNCLLVQKVPVPFPQVSLRNAILQVAQ